MATAGSLRTDRQYYFPVGPEEGIV